MNTSLNLYRFLLCFSIFIGATTMCFASKTTWEGPGNNWNLASNWSDGVPTMADTAIITGGTPTSDVNVLIISTVSALHVQVDAYCILTILGSGSLLVIDAPVHGIRIEQGGRVINNGLINTAFTGNGIYVFGRLDNFGKCSTNETVNGIVFSGTGIGFNKGEFDIKNSNYGLVCSGESEFTNAVDAKIEISDCQYGLSNNEEATFTNDFDIIISDIGRVGLFNRGKFINNKKIGIYTVGGNVNTSFGMVNDSLSYANGNTYIGDFENNGEIEIAIISGTALSNDSSTIFLNKGKIFLASAVKDGFTNLPRAKITFTAGSLLDITDVSISPLNIHLGSIFEIALSATLEVNE